MTRIRPEHGRRRRDPGGRPGGSRPAGPERRGQDLAPAHDGHRAAAVVRRDRGRWTGTPRSAAERREIRRRLGYLPQHLGYYPAFTVVEFVEYFALLKEMPPHLVPKAVATAVEQVDLGARAKARLRTLSGGMLRRVGIAQAIVNDPDLLLFDEPTAGLDPEQRVGFRALMRDLGQTVTVVVSTHLVEDVGAACSEVALMVAGRSSSAAPRGARGSRRGRPALGDAPLERGYSAVLAAARAGS